MLVIRPIQLSDYAALLEMAMESGVGFTSLPVDETLLKAKLELSIQSFSRQANSPGEQHYLMVAEDISSGEVVGTTAIEAAVGLHSPFYTYRLGKVVHASRRLDVYNVVETLTLTNDYTGVSELCSLFLRSSHRGGRSGRLLSKSRFLFMAEHPMAFSETIIAEMRGVSDAKGRSPFWAWLQAHFFSLDFPTVDYLTGVGKKEFIAELMPKYPIYVSLLSEAAQAVIGEVHRHTRPALRLLESEGFTRRGYVDIFDAGPTVECPKMQIHTVRHSYCLRVKIVDANATVPEMLVANTAFTHFRACIAPVAVDHARQLAMLSQESADALQVAEGESVRVAALAA